LPKGRRAYVYCAPPHGGFPLGNWDTHNLAFWLVKLLVFFIITYRHQQSHRGCSIAKPGNWDTQNRTFLTWRTFGSLRIVSNSNRIGIAGLPSLATGCTRPSILACRTFMFLRVIGDNNRIGIVELPNLAISALILGPRVSPCLDSAYIRTVP